MSFIPDFRGAGLPSLPPAYAIASGDGAITQLNGTVYVTKGTAAALTLAAPPTTANGAVLNIMSTTAAAHTVTYTAGFNGASTAGDVATFGAARGNCLTITAYEGVWYVLNTVSVTIA